MDHVQVLAAGVLGGATRRPEYRHLELYSKPAALSFAPPVLDESRAWTARLAPACRAFFALDAFLGGAVDGISTRERYKALPRATLTDKILAQVYRLLRVVRLVALSAEGRPERHKGLVILKVPAGKTILDLALTEAGLDLAVDMVAYAVAAPAQPYPDAYVEAMLMAWYADLTGEIRRFSDEDRTLHQFRQVMPFNRHGRFDCDNARFHMDPERLILDIGPMYRDAARYPIDFYLPVGDTVHIVPVEALDEGALPRDELSRWRLRSLDPTRLPAAFQARFGREEVLPNQPMT
ncbi:hypothetical protein [Pararhodospirillum oryzae]|uniref:Uncharacterized protein n=1 Tax=Pararhodospirillum oryzae TaxID=478448 RepID=A0A512H3I8_9PROT|nr:hypothetical protein [Pararhodospirillum oryzae]GEO80025.1 hypothetical protein ROR02_01560 [Pararhodospirillum oryzae]